MHRDTSSSSSSSSTKRFHTRRLRGRWQFEVKFKSSEANNTTKNRMWLGLSFLSFFLPFCWLWLGIIVVVVVLWPARFSLILVRSLSCLKARDIWFPLSFFFSSPLLGFSAAAAAAALPVAASHELTNSKAKLTPPYMFSATDLLPPPPLPPATASALPSSASSARHAEAALPDGAAGLLPVKIA